jgi:hypothetical protein
MNPVNFGNTGMNSGNFDAGNKEQVLKMQGFLQDQGLYKGALDSQFGGKSEEAYRNYVNTERTGEGQEAYSNKEGFQATPESVQQTQGSLAGRDANTGKRGLGGMLKAGYAGLDKAAGGYLPGGVQTTGAIGQSFGGAGQAAQGFGGKALGVAGGIAGMAGKAMKGLGGVFSAMGKNSNMPTYGGKGGRFG